MSLSIFPLIFLMAPGTTLNKPKWKQLHLILRLLLLKNARRVSIFGFEKKEKTTSQSTKNFNYRAKQESMNAELK